MELALCDSLEQVIQRQVFFIVLTEWRSEHAYLIRNAAETPHITLPIIAFALKHLRTHIQRSTDPTKSFEGLGTELPTETQISHFKIPLLVYKYVCRFQITMHNSLLMHVFECTSYLMDVLPTLLLWK